MQPVEVIIIGIEEVQLFLSDNPDKERALTKPNLISHTLIKPTKTWEMYAKGIEKWQKRPSQDWRKWTELSVHMEQDYGRQLIETGGTTMGQEG